ncbi:hypothetical protein [Sphingobacterium psychroaquaticum]|uniref:hypothetical protein n=1 Tax=Sphingobacterium psychroaquaticum TaxID=561061 RepID=UPI00141B3C19|nr:hypothetical protein [Sphingobacterium psychroaquaticum]
MENVNLKELSYEEQITVEGGGIGIALAAIGAVWVLGEIANKAGEAVGRALK